MRKIHTLNSYGKKLLKEAKMNSDFVSAYTEDGSTVPSFFSFDVDDNNFVAAYSGWLAGIKHATKITPK